MQENPMLDQQQSSLFRFPGEIREMIYRYALVSPVPIHLDFLYYLHGDRHGITSYPCKGFGTRRIRGPVYSPDPYECSLLMSTHQIDEEACADLQVKRQGAGIPLLGLLLSCRKIYSEALDIMYQKNTFCIEKSRNIWWLVDHFSESRLKAIRHLSVESECHRDDPVDSDDDDVMDDDDDSSSSPVRPTPLENWKKAVTTLKQLEGLQTLKVFLVPFVGLKKEKKALEDTLIEAQLSSVDVHMEFRPQVVIKRKYRVNFPQYEELFEDPNYGI